MKKAVLINIMDTSGSIGYTKKSMAKLYMNTYRGFLHGEYEEIESRFVAHTTVAKEVNQDDFFSRGEAGGTYISSGYVKALEVAKGYDIDFYDIYVLQFSDGDNWGEDNDKSVELLTELCENVNMVQYLEIKLSTYTSTIMSRYLEVNKDNLYIGRISSKDDCFDRLKETTKLKVDKVKRQWSAWNESHNDFKYRVKGRMIECVFNDGIRTFASCLLTDTYNLNTGLEICCKKYQLKKLEKELKSF